MAVSVRTIYQTVCWDLAEDFGLQLGIVTPQQFIDLLNLTVMDFLKQTGAMQRIWTQTVFAGVGIYDIPDDIMEIKSVWLAGRWLPPSTQRQLNNEIRRWRRIQEVPRFYYTDGIGLKSIGLAPAPNYNGAFILGANEPNPPHAVYDAFSALCQVGTAQVALNALQHRGLTIIGTQKPLTQIVALADAVPLVPDDMALLALPFGVLERIFSGDNELQDSQRAAFCRAQYHETISAIQAATGETGDPDGQGAS